MGKIANYIGAGIFTLLTLVGPGKALAKYLYRTYQINNAQVQKTFPVERAIYKSGGFDRNGDGAIDQIVEVGHIGNNTSIATYRVLPSIPTSRVLNPSDEQFNNRLEVLLNK